MCVSVAGVQLDVHACQQVLAQVQWFALQQTWFNLARARSRAFVEKQSVMNWVLLCLLAVHCILLLKVLQQQVQAACKACTM